MAKAGYADVSLKQKLIDEIDVYVATNDRGYNSRAAVVSKAVRRFLDDEPPRDLPFKEELYAELLFLLQHTLDTTDPKKDPIQRLQEGLFAWRRYRLDYDEPADDAQHSGSTPARRQRRKSAGGK